MATHSNVDTPGLMPNNGMHPTADTTAFMYISRAGRRVMPGVRLLGRPEEFCWMNARLRRVAKHFDSSVTGHDGRPSLGAGWWREA
jgi:hypothetical protein